MEELVAYRLDLLSALRSVSKALAAAASHLPDSIWHAPIQPGQPTSHYLLFHLWALEAQVFSPHLTRIVKDQPLNLPIFEEEAWMAIHYCHDQPISAILDDLLKLRYAELEWLGNLQIESWSRVARHPWWGVHTLQWWVELQLEYSTQCLRQLTSVKGS
jgi:hypothetical protein